MRIGQKLISGFVAMAVLAGIVGFASFIQVTKVGKAFERVERQTTPAIVALGEIKSNLFFLLLEVNEYILDPSAEHLEEFGEAKEYLRNALSAYEKAEEGEEGEEGVIQALKEGAAKAITLGEELLKLKAAGALEGVLLQRIRALDSIAEDLSRELNEEIEHDGEELKESGTYVRREIDRSINRTVVFALGALLLALGLGIFLSRAISVPLTRLKDAAAKIGQGQLETKIQVESRDEIGELATSFHRMTEELRTSLEKEKARAAVVASAEAEKERAEAEQKQAETSRKLAESEKKRAAELDKVNRQLKAKIAEMENFQRITLGREERVLEMKREVNELLKQLGQKQKYSA